MHGHNPGPVPGYAQAEKCCVCVLVTHGVHGLTAYVRWELSGEVGIVTPRSHCGFGRAARCAVFKPAVWLGVFVCVVAACSVVE